MSNLPMGARVGVLLGHSYGGKGTSLAPGIVTGYRSSARGNSYTVETEHDGTITDVPAHRDRILSYSELTPETHVAWEPHWKKIEEILRTEERA